jgi:flagellar biosynthesis chaperone FliJ
MTSDVDLRGFAYPLEPLLTLQRWDADALQAKLAKLDRQVAQSADALAQLTADYAHRAQAMRAGQGAAFDPTAYGRSLAYLGDLQGQIVEAERQLAGMKEQRRLLQQASWKAQLKVDVSSSHRSECIAEYAASQSGRLNSERDRDWLARAQHSTQGGMPWSTD